MLGGHMGLNIEIGVFTSGRLSLASAPTVKPPFERPPIEPIDSLDQVARGANYTAAPLDYIVRIDVFHERGSDFCRGLLFEYAHRGQRSVGDCRISVDPFVHYLRPTHLCFRIEIIESLEKSTNVWNLGRLESVKRWVTRVKCCSLEDEEARIKLAKAGWTCAELKGWVVFRGGNMHSHITIVQ